MYHKSYKSPWLRNYDLSGSEDSRQTETPLLEDLKEFVMVSADGQLQEVALIMNTVDMKSVTAKTDIQTTARHLHVK
jgi:hypothetical protein